MDETIALDNEESKATALEIARQGIVLLENRNGNLPFAADAKVVVMGPNADVITTGGGSGFVTPYSTVSPYQGLVELLGDENVILLSDDVWACRSGASGLGRNIGKKLPFLRVASG